jgi:hypothetical protein
MHPLVKGACGVAVLTSLGSPAPTFPARPAPARPAAERSNEVAAPVDEPGCPPRSLPLGDERGCIPLPAANAQTEAITRRLAERPASPTYLEITAPAEVIPRLPERPERWADYQLPVDPLMGAIPPDTTPETAATELGILLLGNADAPVTLVDLERQIDRPEVVLVGERHGITVVVRHVVETDRGDREYLVLYGSLARPGPGVASGARLGALAVIGFLGNGEAEDPQLRLEVRETQHERDPGDDLARLVERSIAVDPRNVLPLVP